MDGQQNDYIVSSRDEYIRLARESCMKNLYPQSVGTAGEKAKKEKLHENDKFYTNQGQDGFLRTRMINLQGKSAKLLLIRAICAMAIFLSVILIDRLQISEGFISSENVQEYVTSKKTVDKASEIFVSFVEQVINIGDK